MDIQWKISKTEGSKDVLKKEIIKEAIISLLKNVEQWVSDQT